MLRTLVLLLAALAIAGCGADFWAFSSNTSGPNPGTTFVVVWLSDSPVDDADALEVSVARVEALGPDGTQLLSDEVGTYDLLLLQNGLRARLAEGSIEPAAYDRLRLTFVTDEPGAPRIRRAGVWSPLRFVSPGAHVVEVPHPFTGRGGDTIEIQIDFNARLSVFDAGGELVLNPALDALDPDAAGSIAGRVTGALGAGVPDALVVARRGGLEVRSTRSRADGTYTLSPLTPGIYAVVLEGPSGPLATRSDVVVGTGSSTTVNLSGGR